MRHLLLRPVLFRLASATAAALLAFAICEVALRYLQVGPRSIVVEGVRLSDDPILIYELSPGAWVAEDAGAISSAGLRDREYAKVAGADTFRIAVIGDSVAYGIGVRNGQPMSEVLETWLPTIAGRAPRIEVLNFGVPGYNSTQIARRLERDVAPFAPDVILYLYCVNDPEDPDLGFRIGDLLNSLDEKERRSVNSWIRHADSRLYGLRTYQLIVRTIDSWQSDAQSRLPSVPVDPNTYYSQIHEDPARWSRVKRDIEKMAEVSGAIGAKFVGVIAPHLWSAYDERRFSIDPLANAVAARVKSAFLAAGSSSLDLGPAIAGYSASTRAWLGVDEVHFSETGHRFVALAVLDFLLKQKLVPVSAQPSLHTLGENSPEISSMLAALRDSQ